MTPKLQDNISCKTTFHKLDKTDAVIMSGYSERLNAPNKPILLGGAGEARPSLEAAQWDNVEMVTTVIVMTAPP